MDMIWTEKTRERVIAGAQVQGRAERRDAHGGGTQMAGQGREERHAQMARAGQGQTG